MVYGFFMGMEKVGICWWELVLGGCGAEMQPAAGSSAKLICAKQVCLISGFIDQDFTLINTFNKVRV